VANNTANNLAMFMIDKVTGTLTLIGTVPAGTNPGAISVASY
jgi:6-phosphogluconolactonase (cycloisomerase 2 family)